MKKITLVMIAALSVGLLQACSHSKASSGSDSSATTTTDTTKMTTTVQADSSSVMSDTAFAAKAAAGGMAEVALGKMAATKGADSKVKDFGNMMVMDHGKANAELMGIAKNKNIMLPAALDAEHQAKSDSLSKLSSKDFDKGYVQVMIDGHKKTLALMQAEAANGKDADLKAFAAKTAPVVQMHLDAIMKIQTELR